MSIEKALRNYLNCTGPKIKEKQFISYVTEDNVNAVINTLFSLVNEQIDDMNDSKALDRVVGVLQLLEVLLKSCDGINRKIVSRKILKIYEKLDRMIEEGRKKFKNIRKVQSEFNKVRRKLDVLIELNEERDTKQFDFVLYLIDDVKNVTYLEYAFSKIPSLANVKDKNEIPLFRILVKKYLESMDEICEDDMYYYHNLLHLLLTQKNFQLSNLEKKICLEEIHKYMDHLSFNKKAEKRNKKKLEAISSIVHQIKGNDEIKPNIENIASKYGVHIYFDSDQVESARLSHKPMEGVLSNRVVVDDYTISIDGEGAVEIDDCLSCKKLDNGHYLLGVHIASVLGYFPYESEIVQEAIQRAHSIYLSKSFQTKDNKSSKTIPIFPYEFSADKGSLKEGEKRLARSYFFEIDENGEVVAEKFVKSIIQNSKQMTYQEANRVLEKGSSDTELIELLQNLKEVTSKLDAKYKGTELYNKVKESREDVSELRVKKIGSENIVYQSMLLTGNRVANFFANHKYPLLYRVHEVNEENNQKLQDMINQLTETYGGDAFQNLYQLIDGLYPKGWYGVEGRHDGLDVDHYCHCTSVLRRAADIIVEHALEVCYDKNPTMEELENLREEIQSKASLINARQAPIEYFVKEYQKKYRR